MIVGHRGASPAIDPTAYVAPTAVANSTLDAAAVVPIGWVAVGEEILPPGAHDEIWAIQEGLDLPGTVYGLPRDASARERMARQAAWFAAHRDDRIAG